MRALGIIAALVLCTGMGSSAARAQTCDGLSADEARATTERITARLENQYGKTRTWSLVWGIGYAASAVGFTTAGLLIDDEDRQVDLFVTGGKSTIAALSVFVLPVRVTRPPPPSGDACADLAAARKALAESAKSQAKGRGWIKHAGGLLLNGAGIAIAGSQHGNYLRASVLALSGIAFGQAQIWTQPVGARDLDRSLAIVPVVGPDYAMVSIAGEL